MTEHEKRIRRQAEFAHIDQWLLDHPWQARIWSIGIAIAILELAEFLRFGFDALFRHIGR